MCDTYSLTNGRCVVSCRLVSGQEKRVKSLRIEESAFGDLSNQSHFVTVVILYSTCTRKTLLNSLLSVYYVTAGVALLDRSIELWLTRMRRVRRHYTRALVALLKWGFSTAQLNFLHASHNSVARRVLVCKQRGRIHE